MASRIMMNPQEKIVRCFLFSSALLLSITALAKLISSFVRAEILKVTDSVFFIQFRHLFRIMALIELSVAGFCLFAKGIWLQTVLVSGIGNVFLIYHFARMLIDFHGPRGCLGNLTGALGISPHTAGVTVNCFLVFLLIGSYANLSLLWKCRNADERRISPPLAG